MNAFDLGLTVGIVKRANRAALLGALSALGVGGVTAMQNRRDKKKGKPGDRSVLGRALAGGAVGAGAGYGADALSRALQKYRVQAAAAANPRTLGNITSDYGLLGEAFASYPGQNTAASAFADKYPVEDTGLKMNPLLSSLSPSEGEVPFTWRGDGKRTHDYGQARLAQEAQ